MKQKATITGIMIVLAVIFNTCARQTGFPVLKGPYLGQKPPGMTPEIFAPGIISTGFRENCATFIPGGKELYFGLIGSPFSVILYMKLEENRWTRPEIVPVIGKYSNFDFTLSPDGKKVYFTSNRPLSGKGEPSDRRNLWFIEKTDSGWTEPQIITFPSDNYDAVYPSIADNGNLYFFISEGNEKDTDIFYSQQIKGKYAEPVRLGDEINSRYNDWDAYIAPDESYIIFGSAERPDGFGGSDLYVSFRKDANTWTKAVNMGGEINSNEYEICPYVTADGKYFFFTSQRNFVKSYSETPLTYEEKIRILNSPGNGFFNGDIYWVDARIIEELRPK